MESGEAWLDLATRTFLPYKEYARCKFFLGGKDSATKWVDPFGKAQSAGKTGSLYVLPYQIVQGG